MRLSLIGLMINEIGEDLLGHRSSISISILFSILSFLSMVAPQSRTDLQGAMLKFATNMQFNQRSKIN